MLQGRLALRPVAEPRASPGVREAPRRWSPADAVTLRPCRLTLLVSGLYALAFVLLADAADARRLFAVDLAPLEGLSKARLIPSRIRATKGVA